MNASKNFVILVGLVLFCARPATAQEALRIPTPAPAATPVPAHYRSPSELKKLPIEQLVDVEIISASRRSEPLSQVSSAIDVITANDIQRAGVTNIPDALRLATEMQVAQVDGHTWAISTRGFNLSTANKLQVLLDGRSLYTPLFSGVFWDAQQVFLPDLEQIEIIRGPGATLWGANAVNGVINIRTKSAAETQGFLLYGGGGNVETGFGGLRYGGMIGANTAYRVYAMHQSRDSLNLAGGGDAGDGSDITQAGFRVDSKIDRDNTITLQGDLYDGSFGQLNAGDGEIDGENLLGRWSHQFDEDSTLTVQSYFDRTHRFIPALFEEYRETYDLELQHQIRSGAHDIVYGGNYRVSHDDIGNIGAAVAFLPATDTQHLISVYAQDEWHLVPDVFSLTLGSKLEYNTFSGVEVQPAGRFTWLPGRNQTLWGAISRAVRTPTRIDQDVAVPNPAFATPFILGTSDFSSEELIAYELGYRVKPVEQLSFDLALYYNDYGNLRSQETQPNGQILLKNLGEAESYGGSLAAKWRVAPWWVVDGSVSLLQLQFRGGPGSNDRTGGRGEANDPNASFIAHSAIDLPFALQFDSFLRFVDELPHPATPSYLELDLRLAWSPVKNLELAVVGRNLLHDSHPEFAAAPGRITHEVPRSVYGTIRWSF